jgi:hypothetical protein
VFKSAIFNYSLCGTRLTSNSLENDIVANLAVPKTEQRKEEQKAIF